MYLTVKEAIDLSGKSQTTIHRLCQNYDDSKYIKKEGNKYLVDKDFLMQKYPQNETLIESKDLISSDKEQNLIQSLTEKNLRITELTVENKEIKKQISELEEQIFDHQHELAENIDANISLHKEVKAINAINEISAEGIIPEASSSNEKDLLLYRTMLITGSLMVLIAFIFFMYYFTK